MELTTQVALEQLDNVIEQFERTRGELKAATTAQNVTRMRAAIQRLAPPGSAYLERVRSTNEFEVLGVVKALRDDYAAGYMKTFRQQINADLFSDFLEMAAYLLKEEQLKQPAAVLAGGVLEEHIRKLCELSGISCSASEDACAKPKRLDALNSELATTNVYGKNDQKQITVWCGIRNSAAHAHYDEFDERQVSAMIDGIRSFIARFPA
jgi:hypothetical protein